MTVLELGFPAGRFHATPWGRHVNEGAIEWPPSPWRIARALIATWYLKARPPEVSEDCVRSLLTKLSSPPTFCVPPASTSHTRHYMPINEGRNEKTTKVFDTFIQLPDKNSVLVAWDTTLTEVELAAFRLLAERMSYFGRAESLVEARVLDSLPQGKPMVVPLLKDAVLPEKTELVRLLSPMAPMDYLTWREDFMARSQSPADIKRNTSKKIKFPEVAPDLFAALQADTGDLQAAGWNLPPGSTFVNYARPEGAFTPARRPQSHRTLKLPTVARFALVSTVSPLITRAISIGDRVHKALCDSFEESKAFASVFTGLDSDGKPLSNHRHAHIFCEADGQRETVTNITIWAEMGFGEDHCRALRGLNKVWGHGGHDLRLVLHGIGQPRDFSNCALFEPSRVWRSATPFVSTRHAKTFHDGRPKIDPDNGWQDGSAGHDLLRLLALHPNGGGATIRQLPERDGPYKFGDRSLRSLQFQTNRYDGGGSRGPANGAAFTITFTEERHGPFAFGYGSHFGLGLFIPVRSL